MTPWAGSLPASFVDAWRNRKTLVMNGLLDGEAYGIIPGTTDNFRDFYEVEFSPGYWALGFPTATTPTSWGRIKSLYGEEPGRR